MRLAQEAYDFLWSYNVKPSGQDNQISFSKWLKNLPSVFPDSSHLFSQKIQSQIVTLNEIPNRLQDFDDAGFLNSPLFLFHERAMLLCKFWKLLKKGINSGPKKKHLIVGNSSVGKTHFAIMMTLILRKYYKKFCMINILNTTDYESMKTEYILNEATLWFYDEINTCLELKIGFNIAYSHLISGLEIERELVLLLRCAITKAKENGKKIVFLQDGINLSKTNGLYLKFKDLIDLILLISTSTDTERIESLTRDDGYAFELWTLEENKAILNEEDKENIMKTFLKLQKEEEIELALSFFSCNFHLMSHFKKYIFQVFRLKKHILDFKKKMKT